MYKCGWNGCEKAYGTLNHLNAHVTMQSHGSKRTPEGEFTLSSACTLCILRWNTSCCMRHVFMNTSGRLFKQKRQRASDHAKSMFGT